MNTQLKQSPLAPEPPCSDGELETHSPRKTQTSQQVLVRAIREPAVALRCSEDVAELYRNAGFSQEEACSHAAVTTASGLALYRSLVLGRFKSAIRVAIPRSIALLSEARFTRDVQAFLDREASQSRYARDIAAEFVDWASSRWRSDPQLPEFLADLSRFELLSIEVAAALDNEPGDARAISIDGGLAFCASVRLSRFGHAVHRLDAELTGTDRPIEGTFHLLSYRDARNQVRRLELSDLGAALIERLLGGSTLREATLGACAAIAQPPDDSTLASVASLLEDLEGRGVLLSAENNTDG